MASATSSTSIAPSATNRTRYDVFISFRGEDTRFSFTDHLYEALVGAGIRTFRDDGSINSGEDPNPQIESAIAASRASIVVLSKNYATSASCLDELLLIMERRKSFYHVVIPIFYHVDPSDVRKQHNSFALKVNTQVKGTPVKWAEYKVDRWKAALTKVANLSGKVVSGYVLCVPADKLIIMKRLFNRGMNPGPKNMMITSVKLVKPRIRVSTLISEVNFLIS